MCVCVCVCVCVCDRHPPVWRGCAFLRDNIQHHVTGAAEIVPQDRSRHGQRLGTTVIKKIKKKSRRGQRLGTTIQNAYRM